MPDEVSTYLAPIVYLYAAGMLLFFVLLAMGIYRGLLPSWVGAARSPFGLRLLAGWLTLGTWLVLVWYMWFWPRLLIMRWWGIELDFWRRPVEFWIVLGLWLATLVIVVLVAIKPRQTA